eukprot:TRINITY_DN7042_c0_g1_i1.p2 TRINITY_DN7042_c0_g1~~TRINITY_DN7042_c0_g1_i1.p2  ORF type:complete len:56 (+),score=3.12 TRINITY_DN7042_c0_g1_i1:116-283(+)
MVTGPDAPILCGGVTWGVHMFLTGVCVCVCVTGGGYASCFACLLGVVQFAPPKKL